MGCSCSLVGAEAGQVSLLGHCGILGWGKAQKPQKPQKTGSISPNTNRDGNIRIKTDCFISQDHFAMAERTADDGLASEDSGGEATAQEQAVTDTAPNGDKTNEAERAKEAEESATDTRSEEYDPFRSKEDSGVDDGDWEAVNPREAKMAPRVEAETPNPTKIKRQGYSGHTGHQEDRSRHAHDVAPSKHSTEPRHPPREASLNTQANPIVRQGSPVKRDPTTERIEKRASDYYYAMKQNPHKEEQYYAQFVKELIQEIREKETQFKALSEEMLAGRDRYQPVTNGSFQSEMGMLREQIKTLAKTVIRSPTMVSQEVFCKSLTGKLLSKGVDGRIWKEKRNRAPILQSAVWSALQQSIFRTPFQVYGDNGNISSIWNRLFAEGEFNLSFNAFPDTDDDNCLDPHSKKLPPRDELCEKWKSLTAIRLYDKNIDQKAGMKVVRQAVEKILRPLTTEASDSPSFEWSRDLDTVLDSAERLASLMAQQRSRLELYIPNLSPAKLKEEGIIDRLLDFDDPDGALGGQPVLVVVPALRRYGDGFGNKLDQEVDLEAAQVKCL